MSNPHKGRTGVERIVRATGYSVAGVTAAYTTLPVIGVPIQGKALDGMDALLSMVQMPPGIPVATVAVNGSKNAGLLALQILGVSDSAIEAMLEGFKTRLAEESRAKNRNLAL